MVTVRWTGAAGLEATHDGRTLLVDPYFSRPGKLRSLLARLASSPDVIEDRLNRIPGRLSAIVVGHTHSDHALDIPELARRFPGPIVGSRSLETLLALHGMPGRVTVCLGRERIELPEGDSVTMLPSRHGRVMLGRAPFPGDISSGSRVPLRIRDYRHGAVFMPKLDMGGIVFLHGGSADFVDEELEGHRCDVLFMCVAGWKRRPEYLTRLPAIVKPKVIIPFHHDDFSRPLLQDMSAPPLPFQDLPGFVAQLSRNFPDVDVRVVQTYEAMNF